MVCEFILNLGLLSCRHLWRSLRNISAQEASLFWIVWRLWPRHVSILYLRLSAEGTSEQ